MYGTHSAPFRLVCRRAGPARLALQPTSIGCSWLAPLIVRHLRLIPTCERREITAGGTFFPGARAKYNAPSVIMTGSMTMAAGETNAADDRPTARAAKSSRSLEFMP